MPGKMYTDFPERAAPQAVPWTRRRDPLYVEVTCPQWQGVCGHPVGVAVHMQGVTVQAAPGQGPPQKQAASSGRAPLPSAARRAIAAPTAAPAAAVLNALRTRPPPAGGPDRGRARGGPARRGGRTLDELRAANRTRDFIAATVASPFKIAPPDAVTVGIKLPGENST